MNKKFFTLIAGAFLLAASFGTVNAQTPEYATGKLATVISPELPAIDKVSDRLYQLGVSTSAASSATNLLAVGESSGKFFLQAINGATAANYDLPSTLWRIRVTRNAEGALSYSYVNVKTNLPLNYVATLGTNVSGGNSTASITTSYLGGEVNLWKWQPAVKPENDFIAYPLTSAFGPDLDSTVTLVATGALGSYPTIGLAKYSLGNLPTGTIPYQIYLTPYDATPILLTPDDLNSMLWTQNPLPSNSKVSFSFDPEVKNSTLDPKNLFTNSSFRAVWAVGYPADYALLPVQNPSLNPLDPNPLPYTSLRSNTYDAAAKELKERTFELAYLKAKIAFGNDIANALYEAITASTVTNLTQFGTQVVGIAGALGYDLTPAASHTKAIADIMNTPQLGSRTESGSAAYIIVNHNDVELFLANPSTTQFQKDVIEALVVYLEKAVVDPYNSTFTIEDFGYGAVNPLLSKLQVFSALSPTTTLNDIKTYIANNVESNNRPSGVGPWENQFWSSGGVGNVQDKIDAANTVIANIKADRYTQIKNPNARWISLIVEDNTDDDKITYLSVDTGFITTTQHLGFKVQKFADVGTTFYPWLELNDPARLDLNGRFNFQFHYFPTQDSLVIRAGGFAKKLDNQKNWGALNIGQNPDLGIEKAGVHSLDLDAITAAYVAGTFYSDRNVVKLQLLTNQSEVTIGSSEFDAGKNPRTTVNTLIRIGRNALTDNRTTLESGLYFINLKTNLPERKTLDGAYKYRHIARQNVGYSELLTWRRLDCRDFEVEG
jgi:hypothetical protein